MRSDPVLAHDFCQQLRIYLARSTKRRMESHEVIAERDGFLSFSSTLLLFCEIDYVLPPHIVSHWVGLEQLVVVWLNVKLIILVIQR